MKNCLTKIFIIPGIGFIEARESTERIAENPSSGEPIRLPAKVNLRLDFASELKQAVLPSWKIDETMTAMKLWKIPLDVLQGIERKGGSAD